MGSLMKKSLGGSIHRIREFELEKVNLAEEFDILQIVGEGWFGKILLVEHKATDTEMVLKALPKPYTSIKDFYREFHYGLHLGAHKNIITTYDVAFETAGFYVFSQEYAPLGDLTSNVSDTGIGELHTKRVAKQLSAALEHLHTRDLVHRDVKLDNILVFKSDFSRIKLCDFGETRRAGSVVMRRNEWLPYAPPEVLQVATDGSYMTNTSHDVWQFGIVIFVCLTGCLPWQKAAPDDPRYSRYISWQSSTIPLKRQPKLFKLVSSKAQKLFKKYLEPKPEKRPAGLAEVHRYLEDRWMSKGGMEKTSELPDEEEGLCPSMYSFHSSPEEKNKLLFTLTQYGLETTVDRTAKKDRIRQWIQSSVIEEENEEEIEALSDEEIGPEGERNESRGPVSAPKTNGLETDKTSRRRASTLSLRKVPDFYIPPIDPRIPLEEQKEKNVSRSQIIKTKDKPKDEFSISKALPFQNLQVVNSLSSLDSSDSSTVKHHKINVQLPQSEKYVYGATPNGVSNGVRRSPPVNVRGAEKMYRAYSATEVRGNGHYSRK
ncbi:serine/threonine-protein kinase SBK1 [Tribolium castaneum]|uniref:Serine/threonine-protein kinase SBK1-like Protein n=1 Tax=Tribolium castaneum TaxID=7070 RepID=D6WDG2_TRICA|nr:PREDICTED: serine/threonine-protein kinase SBK1 [Tribolium castaneum]XP_966885.1 PREDICTED: serine/threonine-protein kinase SBK1 [Tribolium castaneum]EFA00768.1 Serine/threonine-protein kinase SBK1-like Protein [Tribolium castaneum]|eukprot:XP_008191103.1 PREDICTED: serine/threonine-protein kinase SBK1 [Tribolium castaneum]